ncbi:MULTISPECIES: ABC transporter permease [unclassified Isoptericola]|uniref:ABC transporter permease n=1 Tax=unclassified Isoptericola TaxID=2623355 RepID=UPI00365BDE96
MLGYSLRRLLQMVPILLGTTFLIFALVFALPGDPIAAMSPDRPLPPSTVNALREQYHLNEPLLVQYWYYVSGIFHGDFGTDFYNRPVSELMAQRWPVTLQLAATAFVMKVTIGLVMGIWSGLRRGRAADHFALGFTVLFLALPGFVVAMGAQWMFGLKLGWFPVVGIQEGWPMAFILPALVMAIEGSAGLSRLTRSSLVDVLRAEYLRTARAKGLSPGRVIWGHAFRNAMVPVVTYLGLSLAGMLGGAVIIEFIFNLPGIGGLMVESLTRQEGTVVVGIATVLVLAYLIFNLLVDLSYGLIDPRIRND